MGNREPSGSVPAPALTPPAVAAVVPAAGASRRMGRPKLLLPWGATDVLGATLAALQAAGVARIVVVYALDGPLAQWRPPPGVELVANPRPELGMLSSVQAGWQALLAAPPEVLVVCPGDQPGLRPETVKQLLAVQRTHGGIVVPSHRGKRGHPLLVPRRWALRIPELDHQIGLRELLVLGAAEVHRVAVEDPGAVADVDTPDAYERLRPR